MKGPVLITDKLGRKIVLEDMDFATEVRCAKIIGAHSANLKYIGLTMPMFFIQSIDFEPVTIENANQLEKLIERVGEGHQSIIDAVGEYFAPIPQEG
jgi:hypothetical protein